MMFSTQQTYSASKVMDKHLPVQGMIDLTSSRCRNYIIVYVTQDDWIEITAVRDARMKRKGERRR